MQFVMILEKIFAILFCFQVVYLLIDLFPRNRLDRLGDASRNGRGDKRLTWQECFTIILCIISCCFFVVVIVATYIKLKWPWLMLIIMAMSILRNIKRAYESVGIITRVVRENEAKKLTEREKLAVYFFAMALWFFDQYGYPERILVLVGQIQKWWIFEVAICLTYLFLYFIHVFYICALMPIPMKILSKLYTHIMKFVPKSFSAACRRAIGFDDEEALSSFYTVKYVEMSLGEPLVCKILGFITTPVVFLAECIILFVRFLFLILKGVVAYLGGLLVLVKGTLDRVTTKCINAPDKLITAVSFRIAIILAFVFTVALNRYQPFFNNYDKSTAVFEFIASTITIPIIFEWIYAVKNRVELDKNE